MIRVNLFDKLNLNNSFDISLPRIMVVKYSTPVIFDKLFSIVYYHIILILSIIFMNFG